MDFGVGPREKTPKSGVAHCKLSPSKKARMSKSKIKSMLICFFLQSGDHPHCQSNFLSEVLERPRKRVSRVRPDITRSWMLHHDNFPHHTAVSSNEFLTEKAFLWFLSLPIRRISIPVTYFFPWLKNHLKGRHFVTLDNILKSITDELKGIPAEAFQHCYEQWKQRLRRCVAAQGDYFEGDNPDL